MTQDTKYKEKINKIIEEQGFYSCMNNTKWRELKLGVSTLDFGPPYSIKTLDEEYNADYHAMDKDFYNDGWWDYDIGYENYFDMYEDATPFFAIEYIKVRPRKKVFRGRLVSDEIIDITEDFVAILHKYNIPYEEEKGTFTIYGYKK